MPFWRTYYHLVWATKSREPLITPKIKAQLYPYLVKKAAELGVHVYALGGGLDHVHMIMSVPPKLAVAQVVKRLKGASSHEINEIGMIEGAFAWQRGYGVMTLGERQRQEAENYVRDQKAHHEAQTVNAWLERFAEMDEGPSHVGMRAGDIAAATREGSGFYDVLGEPLL